MISLLLLAAFLVLILAAPVLGTDSRDDSNTGVDPGFWERGLRRH